ncbi:MAG: hypothetical protein ACF8PN_00105 [Phycisphaerales bacterium]
MKINAWALATSIALVWGVSVMLVGIANLNAPPYGQAFLDLFDSVYPGYHAPTPDPMTGAGAGSAGDVVILTLYALADAFVVTLLVGLIYNFFVGRGGSKTTTA